MTYKIGSILTSLLVIALGCGGSSSPTTPASIPISIEGLDGATDVPVDSTFQYDFDSPVTTSTVDTSSFFIVATPSANIASPVKAAVDSAICNSANAISARTDCSTPATSCTLDPTSDLSVGTSYTICLTTDIDYANRTSFEGFMATFTTAGTASCTDSSCSEVSSLDGRSDVATDSTFQYVFSKAVDTSTVTTSTYFIVTTASPDIAIGIKAVVDTSICNATSALAASVSCNSSTTCELDPTSDLSSGTSYTTCLTTEIEYLDDTSFEGYMVAFVTAGTTPGAETETETETETQTVTPSCTAPTCADIRSPILTANSTGIRPGVALSSSTLPAFTCTGGTPTYSMSSLPSWLSFNTSTRALALNGVSSVPANATSSYTATYTATIDSTTASVQCLLNDMDGDTMTDYLEYNKYGAVPLVDRNRWIWLNTTNKSIYRPKPGSVELMPTGIKNATSGLNFNSSSDKTTDLDGDGTTNAGEVTAATPTNPFAKGPGTFAAATSNTVGTSPLAVASGDLDGDGDIDLAAANSSDDNVSILLRAANGTYGSATNYSVGDNPVNIMAGDFDGDGDLDLATNNSGSGGNNVSIILGAGDGTFGSATNKNVGTSPQGGTLGDFDGDGDLDLAVANSGSTSLSILLGAGNGTFADAASDEAGSNKMDVAAGDLDGDGYLDLVAGDSGSGSNVSVLRGKGDGTFGTAANYSSQSYVRGVALGDFDSDGDLDVATSHFVSQGISILLGNGDGTLGTYTSLGLTLTARKIAAADVDGDNDVDLIVPTTSSTVEILLGNNDGTFATPVSYAASSSYGITVADLDGDGALDLVVGTSGSAALVLLNQ